MRDQQISAYVDEDEKQDIKVLAAVEGHSSVSNWLRNLALEELEEAREEGKSNPGPMAAD